MDYKKMTPQERDAYLAEALDPNQTVIYCHDHMYTGNGTPPDIHCRKCAFVFHFKQIGKLPPHKRAEAVEKLYTVARHITEEVEKGTFNVNLFEKPIIEKENQN